MTQIKPFRAVHYNQDKIADLSEVVCPPYDVISAEDQTGYHNASPYNFVRLDFGKEKPSDDKNDNRYTRAREAFNSWLKKGVLVQDEKPGIYFYKQDFRVRGEKYSRFGFIALMKLQEPGSSKIYPHENTHSEAKEDRLKLCSAVKANLSSIFVCFSDRQKKVEHIFNTHLARQKPSLEAVDADKVRHRVWTLDDPQLVEQVEKVLSDQPLFIADGHHRYEVAMEYRRQRLEKISKPTGKEGFNYVMTYFTNMDSKELQIFPMHRIVKKLSRPLDFLEEFFRIDKVKTQEDLLILLTRAGNNEHAFGLYTREGIKLLRLKNKALIDKYVKGGSKELRSLDANILKSFIFDRVGVKSEDIIYTKDLNLATSMVDQEEAELSFILNPVKVQQLRAIALHGERMPPKTTYFYPKVLSGLTVYKLDS